MNKYQHTLNHSISFSGAGLHTGEKVDMTLVAAETGHGIKFQRIDLPQKPVIPADIDYISSTKRSTSLKIDDAYIYTVEHILAALVGAQVDNVLIQMHGPEVPIMDGSAKQFIQDIEEIGLKKQKDLRNFLDIPTHFSYENESEDVEISAHPLDDYRVTVMVDYEKDGGGTQYMNLNNIEHFSKEIAPCRTFCFLHEIEMLRKDALIKGGELSNALVIVGKEVSQTQKELLAKEFNTPIVTENPKNRILGDIKLRFSNELARHKLLDLMGDLALLGGPLRGKIIAKKPGHANNILFAKRLRKHIQEHSLDHMPIYNPLLPPAFDLKKIQEVLPHRHPFLFVDQIFHIDKTSVAGAKNLTSNESFFQGHFPDNPIMPGVIQIEVMGQIAGVLLHTIVSNPDNYWVYFISINNFRFRKMVTPGSVFVGYCKLLQPIRRGIALLSAKGYVNNCVVCEGDLKAAMVRKK